VNLRNALATEGWKKPAVLEWLAEKAANLRYVAEVGSWMGRSPVLDLRETRPNAIKSLLCPGRNCLQGWVCTSGVPEMKIGGHCRVP